MTTRYPVVNSVGPPGAGLLIKGNLPNIAALPPVGAPGDGWMITAGTQTGHLYLWDPNAHSWRDAGLLRGPRGPRGPQGSVGPTGTVRGWVDLTDTPAAPAYPGKAHGFSRVNAAETGLELSTVIKVGTW